MVCSQTVIQERDFSLGNSPSSAEPRLTAFSKARRAALWTSIASNIGSGVDASAALAGMATAADAASAAAVESKPRRVVWVELVIDFLALPEIEGFDGRSRAVLRHSPGSFFNRLMIAERLILVRAPPFAGLPSRSKMTLNGSWQMIQKGS